jgi:hypothetical protein
MDTLCRGTICDSLHQLDLLQFIAMNFIRLTQTICSYVKVASLPVFEKLKTMYLKSTYIDLKKPSIMRVK